MATDTTTKAAERAGGTFTPGPWAVMKHWPLEIVPAPDAAKTLGAANSPAGDAGYAQPIAQARFDSYVSATEFPHRRVNRAESEANARLIAASPELLAGLQGALKLIRDAQELLCAYLHPDSAMDDRETMNKLLYMFDGPEQRAIEKPARAAIARAEGRS